MTAEMCRVMLPGDAWSAALFLQIDGEPETAAAIARSVMTTTPRQAPATPRIQLESSSA